MSVCMGKIKLIRFPNTFRIEFSQKEFVCNKGHYSLDNIEKKNEKEKYIREKIIYLYISETIIWFVHYQY